MISFFLIQLFCVVQDSYENFLFKSSVLTIYLSFSIETKAKYLISFNETYVLIVSQSHARH